MKALCSWAIFHSSGFRNNEHKYEVFIFGFGNSTIVQNWEDNLLSIICHQTNKQTNAMLLSRKHSAWREREHIHSWCYIAKIKSLKCIHSWMKSFTNTEKAARGFFGKCKYLKGMSILWHEDRTPELPFLNRNTLDSLCWISMELVS